METLVVILFHLGAALTLISGFGLLLGGGELCQKYFRFGLLLCCLAFFLGISLAIFEAIPELEGRQLRIMWWAYFLIMGGLAGLFLFALAFLLLEKKWGKWGLIGVVPGLVGTVLFFFS